MKTFKMYKEGWQLFFVVFLDSAVTFVLVNYFDYREINSILFWLQKYCFGTLFNILVLKVVVSFVLILFLCSFSFRENTESFTRKILRVVSLLYFLFIIIMVMIPILYQIILYL